jgi:di/tricarboxylate transporter
MLSAVVWHFWLAVPLAASAILWVIATVLGYFMNVTRAKYPKSEQ